MSKFAPINTLDYRLSMMNFFRPDSTKTTTYHNRNNSEELKHYDGDYGFGWYWHRSNGRVEYRFSKKSIVELMEKEIQK